MFYLYRPTPPNYFLLKTNPKEYQERMKKYVTDLTNYRFRLFSMECDMMALRNMHIMYHNNSMGIPCPGCTLGGGFGIYM